MADFSDRTTALVTWIIIAALLLAATTATGFLYWLGDWEQYAWCLNTPLRIVWGSALFLCVATALTRVTIFGWNFRNWFRPVEKIGLTEPPWPKSGLASFAITVALVALLGLACTATAVMWILRDAVGDWVMGLVIKLVWAAWWVLAIAVVLVRVFLFRLGMLRATRQAAAEKTADKAADGTGTP